MYWYGPLATVAPITIDSAVVSLLTQKMATAIIIIIPIFFTSGTSAVNLFLFDETN